MNKKILILISLIILLCIGLFILTGCKNNPENTLNEVAEKTEITNDNKIETIFSFYSEGFLFKSKKSVEHVIYLDKNNKLVKYEHIEKYFEFTDDNNYNMIAEGVYDEAELNNRTYKYLNETVEVKDDSKEVTISDMYDISKLESKNQLPSDELEDNLSDDYILNVENYKNAMTNKKYTYKEK